MVESQREEVRIAHSIPEDVPQLEMAHPPPSPSKDVIPLGVVAPGGEVGSVGTSVVQTVSSPDTLANLGDIPQGHPPSQESHQEASKKQSKESYTSQTSKPSGDAVVAIWSSSLKKRLQYANYDIVVNNFPVFFSTKFFIGSIFLLCLFPYYFQVRKAWTPPSLLLKLWRRWRGRRRPA